MSATIPVYMVPSPPDELLRVKATHELYRLATFIKATAVEEELSTHMAVSFDEHDAAMILTMAERALKMLADNGFKT